MQSRLAATVWRSSTRLLISESPTSPRKFASPPIPTRLPADPAIYSGDPQGKEGVKAQCEEKKEIERKLRKELNDPYVPPKPPHSPSPKLKHTELNQPIDPTTQQKRRNTTTSSANTGQLQDMSCTGFFPWVEDREEQGREQEEDDKEYFKHHKASPLSEIELVDTRKPVSRAMDGFADYYYRGERVVLWRPEQLDTAEEALMRATQIWKQNAMRGDPDSPHGRVLRALRGEDW
ncbi:uncharacterized protein LOC132310108 [Cornus florida]|uniref:uncharacterized protein LOC132310108 n=1 Tax=Cornus florida TaxID=4283 RepID=UPI0028A1AF42|nr:uncharacterized protein LOC132310108 [Cornus florida]